MAPSANKRPAAQEAGHAQRCERGEVAHGPQARGVRAVDREPSDAARGAAAHAAPPMARVAALAPDRAVEEGAALQGHQRGLCERGARGASSSAYPFEDGQCV